MRRAVRVGRTARVDTLPRHDHGRDMARITGGIWRGSGMDLAVIWDGFSDDLGWV